MCQNLDTEARDDFLEWVNHDPTEDAPEAVAQHGRQQRLAMARAGGGDVRWVDG